MNKEIVWFFKAVKPLLRLQLIRLSAIFVVSGLALVDPLIIKWIIDDVLIWKNPTSLLLACAIFLGVYVWRLSFMGIAAVLEYYVSQRIRLDLRLKIFAHIQALSPRFYLENSLGDVMHRIDRDVEKVSGVWGGILGSLLQVSVMTIFTLVILAFLSWKVTLAILPLIPAIVLLKKFCAPRLRQASDIVLSCSGRFTAFLQERLASMQQLQILGSETRDRLHFMRIQRTVLNAEMRRRYMEVGLRISTVGINALAMTVVLAYGGYQVILGAITVGSLIAIYTYLNRIFEPLGVVVEHYSMLQRAGASIRRIIDLLEVEPEVPKCRKGRKINSIKDEIVFSNVSFSYESESPVLRGLDLRIPSGSRLSLVGFSGCGKSTLGRLLVRLMETNSGEITIDGMNTKDYNLKCLRSTIQVVPQDPILFDATLRENILCANPKAKEKEILEVIRLAELENVLASLPKGLDEPLGTRGESLSGGQRQRLAIARAILKKPDVVVLDEATSALDGPTERRILENLHESFRGRTVILIAHRLSAILWAERIVVMHQGRILEDGDHESLYRLNGIYRELCEKQLVQSEDSPEVVDDNSRREMAMAV